MGNALTMGGLRKYAAHELEAEIFSVGTWNGDTFTQADLEEIAANFEELKDLIKPPLKLGHDEQQVLDQEDGQPALGWVKSLRVAGDKLLAVFADVPAVVMEAIKAGRYRRISSEIFFNVRHGKKKHGKALKAVALLGADLPAVNNLEDLAVLLKQQPVAAERAGIYTAINGPTPQREEKRPYRKYGAELAALLNRLIDGKVSDDQSRSDIISSMAEAAGIAPGTVNQILDASIDAPPAQRLAGFARVLGVPVSRLENALPADSNNSIEEDDMPDEILKAQLETEREKNKNLTEANKKFTDDEEARKKAEGAAAVKTHREGLVKLMDDQVKAGNMLPAQREQAVKLFGIEDDARVMGIEEETLKTFIEAGSKKAIPGEQGLGGTGEAPRQGEDASDELARLANVAMAEHKLTYGQAAEYVLRNNPDLAAAYRKFTAAVSEGEKPGSAELSA